MSDKTKEYLLNFLYFSCLIYSFVSSTIYAFILVLISFSISSILLHQKLKQLRRIKQKMCENADTCERRV